MNKVEDVPLVKQKINIKINEHQQLKKQESFQFGEKLINIDNIIKTPEKVDPKLKEENMNFQMNPIIKNRVLRISSHLMSPKEEDDRKLDYRNKFKIQPKFPSIQMRKVLLMNQIARAQTLKS